jgi:hypothetical protein
MYGFRSVPTEDGYHQRVIDVRRRMRAGPTISALGFNLSTGLLQWLGLYTQGDFRADHQSDSGVLDDRHPRYVTT